MEGSLLHRNVLRSRLYIYLAIIVLQGDDPDGNYVQLMANFQTLPSTCCNILCHLCVLLYIYFHRGLSGNSLNGTLSPDMCQLTGLWYFDVKGNILTETIQEITWNCTSFETLYSVAKISGIFQCS